jgi:hypothetical protein
MQSSDDGTPARQVGAWTVGNSLASVLRFLSCKKLAEGEKSGESNFRKENTGIVLL